LFCQKEALTPPPYPVTFKLELGDFRLVDLRAFGLPVHNHASCACVCICFEHLALQTIGADRVQTNADVAAHGDEIAVRSCIDKDGQWVAYQEGPLAIFRTPRDLIAGCNVGGGGSLACRRVLA
jgi:hypothetical protein